MKLKYYILPIFFTILFQSSFCQSSVGVNFDNCDEFKDSCLVIGNKFIDDLKSREFTSMTDLFSENILFRALIPASIETSNNPNEIVSTFKSWFGREGMENFKVDESNVEMMVDCLHISYTLTLSYKEIFYKVQQQLYCEVESGKISKLSLICSGFWKID